MSKGTPARGIAFTLSVGHIGFAAPMGPTGKGFHQPEKRGRPVGSMDWISGILNTNHSIYYEGMSVPQRIIFTGIPSTTYDIHVLTFEHDATKADVHAFDFLTS